MKVVVFLFLLMSVPIVLLFFINQLRITKISTRHFYSWLKWYGLCLVVYYVLSSNQYYFERVNYLLVEAVNLCVLITISFGMMIYVHQYCIDKERENKLKEAVNEIRDNYDYIFIDCPPSLGLITLNALTAADAVLVPIQCEFYALEGLSQLMNTVQLVQKHLNKKLQVEGVVMTMFDARTNLSIEVVEEVRRHFGNKVYNTIIPRNIKLSEAPSFGLPIVLYDKSCKGAEAYLDLADEFIAVSERG